MTPELTVMATFALSFLGGLTAAAIYVRDLRGLLQERELLIRQLLDRLTTNAYGEKDPVIGRMHVAAPPSVREEAVSGPHGRAFNTVAGQAAAPEAPERPVTKRQAGRKTQKMKLDTADEFNRKPGS